MELFLAGQNQQFESIKTFRARFRLPISFGVAFFEPENEAEFSSIERVGWELQVVQRILLERIPAHMPDEGWTSLVDTLPALFGRLLYQINPKLRLKPQEIEQAVRGLREICHLTLHTCFQALMQGASLPGADAVYRQWLNSSARILPAIHSYPHEDQIWLVGIVRHAYGRVGLVVDTADELHYVHDNRCACPAEPFMESLLYEVIQRIISAVEGAATKARSVKALMTG